jgi:hypothetical protein
LLYAAAQGGQEILKGFDGDGHTCWINSTFASIPSIASWPDARKTLKQ